MGHFLRQSHWFVFVRYENMQINNRLSFVTHIACSHYVACSQGVILFFCFIFSMVYETERDVVRSDKDSEKGEIEIKYVPNPANNSKKSLHKNSITSRKTDESKIPLQISEMDGDMMVDEYSGSDNSSDDLCLIPPRVV